MTQNTYTIDQIRTNLKSDYRWTERAIVKLYDRQTRDEQNSDATLHHNNVGFNGGDAPRLSYYAKYIMSGRRLTGRHLEAAQRMTVKYARQILEMIEEKQTA
jgi:hypothetical protein